MKIRKTKIYTTMNQKGKLKRERYAMEQEKKGKKTVEYIVWGLIILGVGFAIYSTTIA